MDEKILIMCGGAASRMIDWNSTKCLLPIPSNCQSEGFSETLIERLIRQLGILGKPKDSVVLVVGYRSYEVRETIPWLSTITIKNPDAPESIMTGIRDALEQFPDLTRYTFLLGDTIWRQDALVSAFSNRTNSMGIVFLGNPPEQGEMYTMRIVSDQGNMYLRDIIARQPDLFTCYGIKFAYLRSKKQKQKVLPFNLCRINDLYRHTQTTLGNVAKKVPLTGVRDIDDAAQYANAIKDIRKGVYA